ncbi:hypothetical protein [Mucilaginibacter lacusdianchii]|uniref:hypothetical protein n=1 Tax=Mucilaginibacter lacusdianchii TaxID=2684211 RepID=UPI00131D7C96|nr:hypothetical protein [Mucilaginibacter sp. JXJ CY 39]
MKKLLLAAALFASVATISSCTKENDAQPNISKKAAFGPGDKSTLGTGDGTRPSEGG